MKSRRNSIAETPQGNDVYFPYMANTLGHPHALTLLLLAVLSAGISCAPPPPRDTHDADVRSITEGELVWVRDWTTRDTEGIVARYADEATVMPPNSPPASGREAIREMVKQYVRDGNFAINFEAKAVEVARSGDYGYVQGNYTLTTTGADTKKPVTDRGSYLRIYRKQLNGSWKVSYEMRASSLPAGSQP